MTIDRNRAAAAHPIPCIGALAPHFDGFSALLAGKGYSASTLLNKRELVAILSRWLKQRRMSLIRLDEALLKTFHAGYRGTMRRGDVSCGRKLLSYLRGAGAIPKPAQKIDRTALGQLTRDYEHCLTSERGLAGATVINNLRIVRQFLTAYFEDPARRMQDLQPQDLHRFILKEAHRVSRCQAQITAGRLRSFVRFLRQRGIVKTDLAVSIPRVRRYKLSQLPKFLPREQIERVLKACDRRTPKGLRDYTMLLLMARLGLRAGEVVAMTLDDLDWEHGEFIVRGKGQRHERLPLPKDVGAALVHYLRHGRPECSTRRVFICMTAPLRGLGSSDVIVHVVHEALDRAGLNPSFKGSHLFRHSLATCLLRKGASLSEIGQVLRHQQQETTQIYAKVDIKALRGIALPWMGGAS
jgi:site-specific recombinase XerD